jgi:hypothetical protein
MTPRDPLDPTRLDRFLVWVHKRFTRWLVARGTLALTHVEWKPTLGVYPEIDPADLASMTPLDLVEPIDPRVLELLRRTPFWQAEAKGKHPGGQ